MKIYSMRIKKIKSNFKKFSSKILRNFLRILCFPKLDNIGIKLFRILFFSKRKVKLKYTNHSYTFLYNLKPEITSNLNISFFDNITKREKDILHYKFLSFNTEKNFNNPDFIKPIRKHKHGWILADILKAHKNKDLYIIKNSLKRFLEWKSLFKIGHGLPYIISLTISQRIIHWSLSIICLESENFKDIPEQKNYSNILIDSLINETIYLIIRGTFLNKTKNNFFISEVISIILSYEVLKKHSKISPIFKNIINNFKQQLSIFLRESITEDSFSNEGSIFYTNFIMETLSLLHAIKNYEYDKYLINLFIYIYSISKDNKILPEMGDISFEHALEIYKYENNNKIKYDILNKFLSDRKIIDLKQNKINKIYKKFNNNYKDLIVSSFNNHTSIQKKNFYFLIDHENIPSAKKNGGHAHQDLSSFILDFKEKVIVNSGTYSYFDNKLRDKYRSQNYQNLPTLSNFCYGILERKYLIINYPEAEVKKEFDESQLKISIIIKNLYNKKLKKSDENIFLKREFKFNIISGELLINDSYYSKYKNNFELNSHLHFHNNIKIIPTTKNIIYLKNNENKSIGMISFQSKVSFKITNYLYSEKYGEKIKSKKLILGSNGNSEIRFKIKKLDLK